MKIIIKKPKQEHKVPEKKIIQPYIPCPCGKMAKYVGECGTHQCETCKRFLIPSTGEWIVEMNYEKEIFIPMRKRIKDRVLEDYTKG